MRPVEVYGVVGGPAAWPPELRTALAAADLVVGGPEHGAATLDATGRFLTWCSPVEPILAEIERAATAGERVVVLASGDPLLYGAGRLLVRRLGAAGVRIRPAPSSVALACARLGWPVAEVAVVSVHGRSLVGVAARLREAHYAAILTGGDHTPQRVAAHLAAFDPEWETWVAVRLALTEERLLPTGSPDELAAEPESFASPNLLLLARPAGWRPAPRLGYFAEGRFARRTPRRSLITKREVRVVALGLLALAPDAVVWDVGAGSGSVAIEAARLAPEGRVFAIERHPESLTHLEENRRRLGADNVTVVAGEAPEALTDLPAPDAVFVGGAGGRLPAILAHAWRHLRPGGRLVVAAITLETLTSTYAWLAERDPGLELVQLQVARGQPLARLRRWEALNPVTLLAACKAQESDS